MKRHTVREALAIEPGESIEGFQGTVKKVWPRSGGVSAKGRDWTCQGIVCEQDGASLAIKLWNRAELRDEWVGRTIWIDSGGPGGLKMQEYKGKSQLNVGEDSTVAQAGKPLVQVFAEEGNAAQPHKTQGPSAPTTGRMYAAQCSVALAISINAAHNALAHTARKLGSPELAGSAQLVADLAALVFQSLERNGYIATMPNGVDSTTDAHSASAHATPASDAVQQPNGADEVPF